MHSNIFIGQKVGMSQIFLKSGEVIPVTLLKITKNFVVGAKSHQNSTIVTVASVEQKAHRVSKPNRGIFEKLGIKTQKYLSSFKSTDKPELGHIFDIQSFKIGMFVDVTSKSIGKGYSGVMKRHNFKGLESSHGVSVSHRSGGSTGQCQDPGRVFKGKKMAGRQGNKKVTVQNLRIVDINEKLELLIIKGSVPGFNSTKVLIKEAIKKQYGIIKS